MISLPFNEVLAEALRNGVYKPKELHGSGVPVINMKELFAFDRLGGQATDRVKLEPDELLRVSLETGDLLFARRSFVLEGSGKCSIVHSLPEPTTFESSMIRARLDRSRAVPEFFFYFFKSPQGRAAMASISTRTAVSGITSRSLAALPVPLPPLDIQRKIVSVLSAYDDLIEINRGRITILDEMAQRIYRDWFVDFRYPGHQNVPLRESTLGCVPEGWDATTISECCVHLARGITPKYDDTGPGIVINQRCIRHGRLSLSPSRRHITTVPDDKFLKLWDVVINSTGVGTLGRVAQVLNPLDATTCDSHVSVVRANPARMAPAYWGLALLTMAASFEAMGAGSTGQTELSRHRIASAPILVPPMPVQERFEELVRPIRSLAVRLDDSCALLAESRDRLLPRLISGKLDIQDLDIAAEEAAA